MESGHAKVLVEEPIVSYQNNVSLSTILTKLYGNITINSGPNAKDIVIAGKGGGIVISKVRPETNEEEAKRLITELKKIGGTEWLVKALKDIRFSKESEDV